MPTIGDLKSVTLKAGTKVWPFKQKDGRTWATTFVSLEDDFTVYAFQEVPPNAKFSKFTEQNKEKAREFVVGMFLAPIHEEGDAPSVDTLGFVFDLAKALNVIRGDEYTSRGYTLTKN